VIGGNTFLNGGFRLDVATTPKGGILTLLDKGTFSFCLDKHLMMIDTASGIEYHSIRIS
jgi:hypothetical protein